MNKKVFFMLQIIVIILAACASPLPSTPQHAEVIVETLIVYECPELLCDQVGGVGLGDELHIKGMVVGGFLPIAYFGSTKYVLASGTQVKP